MNLSNETNCLFLSLLVIFEWFVSQPFKIAGLILSTLRWGLCYFLKGGETVRDPGIVTFLDLQFGRKFLCHFFNLIDANYNHNVSAIYPSCHFPDHHICNCFSYIIINITFSVFNSFRKYRIYSCIRRTFKDILYTVKSALRLMHAIWNEYL